MISMFDLHKVPNFIKVGTHCNFETKSAQFRVKILNFQMSYLKLTNLTCSESQILQHWEYILFLGHNFPGMMRLILVLMSNACCLALVFFLFFFVVTWQLLLVTRGYCSLPLVTARSHFQYERKVNAVIVQNLRHIIFM